MAEARHRIADLEIIVRIDDAQVLADLTTAWCGYASTSARADVLVDFSCDPDDESEQPDDIPYPAFGCEAVSATRFLFARRGARGQIDLAPDLLHARFVGLSHRSALEATLRLAVALALPRRGGLLLHSSGLAIDGRAFVFLGPSGAGKTTIAGLLGGVPLGDDLVAVTADGTAHATPFHGDLGAAPAGRAPLAGLYFLRQAERHLLSPITPTEALPRLLRNTSLHVEEREGARRALDAAAGLVRATPCYVLDFAKDPGVAGVLGVTCPPPD